MDHEPHNSPENRSNSSFTRTEISTNHLACSVPSFVSIFIITSISVFGVCGQNVFFDQSQNESSDTSHSNCWKRQKCNHVFSASALLHYKTSLTTCKSECILKRRKPTSFVVRFCYFKSEHRKTSTDSETL